MTGEELRTVRTRLGWSQDELASRLGVTRRTVIRWEMGHIEVPPMVDLALEALQRQP